MFCRVAGNWVAEDLGLLGSRIVGFSRVCDFPERWHSVLIHPVSLPPWPCVLHTAEVSSLWWLLRYRLVESSRTWLF